MIANAKQRGLTDRHIRRLEKERDKMENDIRGSWDRALGRYGLPEDPDGWVHWSMQKLRAWNFIKYGTGFSLVVADGSSHRCADQWFQKFHLGQHRADAEDDEGSPVR